MAQNCMNALIKNKKVFLKDVSTSLHYFNIFERSANNISDTNVGASLFGLTNGGILDIAGNFDNFQENRTNIFNQVEFDYSNKESVTYLSEGINDDSVRAYFACLNSEKSGLIADIIHADRKTLTIRFEWRIRDGFTPAEIKFNINRLEGVKGGEGVVPTSFHRDNPDIVTLDRKKNSDFSLVLSHPKAGDITLSLKKPFAPRKGYVYLVASFWADGRDFNSAPNKYVDHKLFVVKANNTTRKQMVLKGTHAGVFHSSFEINSNGAYKARFDRPDGTVITEDGYGFRDSGESVAHWLDPNYQIPANYFLSVVRVA